MPTSQVVLQKKSRCGAPSQFSGLRLEESPATCSLHCTPKVRSTQNPAAAQQAHTALKSQHSIVSHHTRILVNPSTTAPGTREPAVHGDAFFCKSPAYAATSLGAPRDRDGDRDGDLSALRRRAADARPRGELPSSNQPSSPQGTLMARALCKKTTGMRLVMS